jgi:magnesium-transporting ATPase (P-type)
MEMALVAMAHLGPDHLPRYGRLSEAPFDTGRKRLSTLNQTPSGPVLYTKGAPETVLPLCDKVRTSAGIEPFGDDRRSNFFEAQRVMADQGLRVLALASRPVPVEHTAVPGAAIADQTDGAAGLECGLVLCGLVGLEDPPRAEVPAAIRTCHDAGIRVIMVTGDHPHTARAIARQIGLVPENVEPTVIHGDDLRRMSPAQLQLALDAPHILFARVAADQKMRVVVALKRKKQVVAVTGDGVNDAPALREADIGIAMGKSGTDVAREAADMVLLDDNFASIVAAVEEGRAVYANIRKFMTYILTSNVPEMVPYLAFVLFKVPLALTVIQILAVDLGTDMLPALALGAQPPDPAVMSLPPRPASQRLLNLPLLLRSYGFLGLIEATGAMAAFFFVLAGAGWSHGQPLPASGYLYHQATAACLAAIICMQVANVFACAHERASIFHGRMAGAKFIFVGVATEIALILLIVYTPFGNVVFGTAPLAGSVWLFVLPFAAGLLLLEEARKWVVRRWCKPWARRSGDRTGRPTVAPDARSPAAPDPWQSRGT